MFNLQLLHGQSVLVHIYQRLGVPAHVSHEQLLHARDERTNLLQKGA